MPRSAGWLVLHRSSRAGRHAWVISTPKKVLATSVRRSRIRRLIREAVKKLAIQPPAHEMWRFSVKADPPQDIRMQDVAEILGKLVESK